MKKLLIIIVFSIILIGCKNKKRTENLLAKIEDLRERNDSLVKIVNGIKNKYVFDSLTFRQIPHYANTNKLNSIHQEEFVFVGYNVNGKTYVIIGYSTYYENGIKIFNGDTLPLKKRGFEYKVKLVQDRTVYGGILNSQNEYGKSYQVPFSSPIGAVKN